MEKQINEPALYEAVEMYLSKQSAKRCVCVCVSDNQPYALVECYWCTGLISRENGEIVFANSVHG